ncbi:MAG TPA: S-methyl-5'-thioinosine phosphorylase [Burkholderiales bacterium]|nr:S-methyl-5'-thioinosine phosphorylase [Burkholderiales bacterium]
MLAIIGGSGLTKLGNLDVTHRKAVRTPYGEPSGALTFGNLCGCEVVFLARHGYGHTIAPHEVNYRANLWALHAEGVTEVVSIVSTGAIHGDLAPGSLVIPHQIIDYTAGRRATFFEGGDVPVTHVDFTHPFTESLRQRLLKAATSCGESILDQAVYAVTQGPRLETAAEILRYERDGADIVGMTGMPEAVLARELELDYACMAVIVNHAAGKGDSASGIQFATIEETLRKTIERARRVLEQFVGDCVSGTTP